MVKVKSIIAQLAAANAVPTVLAFKNPQESEGKGDERSGFLDMGSKEQINLKCLKTK